MKRILMSTSLISALAMPVYADTHGDHSGAQMADMGVKASNLLDRNIYMPGAENSDDMDWDLGITDVPDTWEMVGEIDDVILTRDGAVRALLVDAGGFLGMGETEKRIELQNVQFVQDSDTDDAYYVVFKGDRGKFAEQMDYDAASAQSAGEMRATQSDEMSKADQPVETTVDWTSLNTEDLLGVAVYGTNDNWIGDLSELSLAEDGKIDGAIVDVGGFLGIGEKAVEMPMDKIDLRRTEAGDLRAYVNATEEELDSMHDWYGDTDT